MNLRANGGKLAAITMVLSNQWQQTRDTWQDQEHVKFSEEFKQTVKALKKFVEVSNQLTPYLLRKAQRVEEYLNQR